MKKVYLLLLITLFLPAVLFSQTITEVGTRQMAPNFSKSGEISASTDSVVVCIGDSVKLFTTYGDVYAGSYVYEGYPTVIDVYLHRGWIFAALSNKKISMINTNDLNSAVVPVEINLSPNSATKIMAVCDTLYAILDDNTFKVWEITSLANPQLKFTSEAYTSLNSFEISSGAMGDTIWMLDSDSLRVLDLIDNYAGIDTISSFGFSGDPELNDIIKPIVKSPYTEKILIAADDGIHKLDVSDAANPIQDLMYSGSYQKLTHSNFYYGSGAGDYVYIYALKKAPANNTFDVFNVKTGIDFSVSILIASTSRINDIRVNGYNEGTKFYISTNESGWMRYNLWFNPPAMSLEVQKNIGFWEYDAAATENFLYAALGNLGIRIYDYSMTDASKSITESYTHKSALHKYGSVLVYKNWLFAGHGDGIEIFEIDESTGNITSKNVIYGTGEYIVQMAVKDDVLLAVTGTKVKIYDLENSPDISFTTDISQGSVSDVWVVNDNVYFSVDNPGGVNDGLKVYDISDPSSPGTVAHDLSGLGYFQNWKSVTVDENEDYAYIASGDSIVSINLTSNTEADTFVQYPGGGHFTDLILKGNYLTAAYDSSCIYIIDVTDPSAMVEKTSHTFTDSSALKRLHLHGFSLFGIFVDGVQMMRDPFGSALFESGRFLSFKDADTVSLKIELMNDLSKSVSDTNTYSFEFKILFDTLLLDTIADANGFTALDSIGTMLDASGFMVTANRVKDTVNVSGSGSLPLGSGPGQFLNVLFKTKTGVASGDTVNFYFKQSLLNDGFPHAGVKKGYLKFKPHFGDVSAESGITAYDASMVLQHMVSLISLLPDSILCAEVSGNGKVGAFDASLILRYSAGLISSFPSEATYLQKPAPAGFGEAEFNYELEYDEITKTVSVPLSLTDPGNIYSMEIEFDHNGYEYSGYTFGDETGGFLAAVSDKKDKLKLSMAGAEPVKEDGVFITLHFKIMDNESPKNVIFRKIVLNEEEYSISGLLSENILPETYELFQNYPNPFNPETTFRYQIPSAGKVNMKIYNVLGQEVKTLVSKFHLPGKYSTKWDGTNETGIKLPSGIYFYRFKAGDFISVKKMVLLK